MTWGPMFMYYRCDNCGKKFKYELDLMVAFGQRFGCCPKCGTMGTFEKDGPRLADDNIYEEVEDD